jgi:hypothetical protein
VLDNFLWNFWRKGFDVTQEYQLDYSVADIHFAFDNSKLIELMTERGKAISNNDKESIEEADNKIRMYINSSQGRQ